MWKAKLALGTNEQFKIPVEEQIKLFHKTGFEGFFTDWSEDEDIAHYRQLANELGMAYQSIHAPFGKAADFWEDSDKANIAVDELIKCVHSCADNDVPIMVAHVIIGFDKHSPNEVGVKNYEKVVKEAVKYGVKVAFENTEGEEYLDAVMKGLSGYDNVGFCWDTGHEMCYNHSKDMPALYGDRLIATHLNDNLGIKNYNGEITWIDDLHLLPFDGIADWEGIAKRLNKHGFNDILTFELNKESKPDRAENNVYTKMPIEEYIAEAYKHACRFAALKERLAQH